MRLFDVKLRAKDVIKEMFRDPLGPMEPVVERALIAEQDRVGDMLKDPHFVKANWMRGGINTDFILPDEIDLFRLLRRSGGKRSYAEIAKYLAAAMRGKE